MKKQYWLGLLFLCNTSFANPTDSIVGDWRSSSRYCEQEGSHLEFDRENYRFEKTGAMTLTKLIGLESCAIRMGVDYSIQGDVIALDETSVSDSRVELLNCPELQQLWELAQENEETAFSLQIEGGTGRQFELSPDGQKLRLFNDSVGESCQEGDRIVKELTRIAN